jgi:hypothetical protein
MRALARLCIAMSAIVLVGGCYFDNPLTSASSKNLNTWLLGVWESKDEDGRVSRIMVTPATESRYFVKAAIPGKNPRDVKKYDLEGWTSRVGDTLFLTLKAVDSPGDIPTGAYVFCQVQLLDQNNVRIRTLQLDSPPTASSFELRKEVRQKLKAKTLYAEKSTKWQRVEEVFWSMDGENPAFKPLRNPMPVLKPIQPPSL